MERRCAGALLLGVAVLAAASPLSAQAVRDHVRLENAHPLEKAVLVDGARGGTSAGDVTYTSLPVGRLFVALFPGVLLRNFTLSIHSNEVIGFSRERPPVLRENVAWTPGADVVTLRFDSAYRLPLFVWIVGGPFGAQRDRAAAALIETARIWDRERQGFEIASVAFFDATADSDAAAHLDFHCGKTFGMRSAIGFDPRGLNVYYLDTVLFDGLPSTAAGVWCGGDEIAMGLTPATTCWPTRSATRSSWGTSTTSRRTSTRPT